MDILFSTEITKAEEVDGKLYLAGVASTTDVDRHRERMAASALHDMAKTAIGVPLTNSHTNELENQIGSITEARVEGDKLVIKAEVDADDAAAVRLYKKVQKGFKAAFSVGGKITSDRPTVEKGAQRIITGVVLDHIMLTSRPANTNTFAVALAKTFDELDAEDLEKSDISAEEREKYATYHENGEGKFPIRPGSHQDAESALRLIGHAPADKQPEIRKRACSILGDSHPACKDITKTNGDDMDQDTDLEKAGAKFSSDSKAALKDIHDAGNDDVKAKVRAMLGDEAEDVLGAPNPDADGDDDAGADDGKADEFIGIAKAELSAEQLAEIKQHVTTELRKALTEVNVKAKGSDDVTPGAPDLSKLSKSELAAWFRAELSKGLK